MARKKAKKAPGKDAAPRPQHWPHAWLAIGAFAVSAISLVVTVRGCTTAEDNLRISQQPYLFVRTSILTVRGMQVFPNQGGPRPADNSPPVVIGGNIDPRQAQGDLAIHYEFEIENAGKTPAILEELVLSFKMPEGWELIVPWTSDGVRLTQGVNRASITMEAVSPGNAVQKSITIGTGLTQDARVEFLKKRAEASINGVAIAGMRGPIQLNGELKYRDEIGQREPLRWCKVLQMNLPVPLDCISNVP